jgi:hypothetical protein
VAGDDLLDHEPQLAVVDQDRVHRLQRREDLGMRQVHARSRRRASVVVEREQRPGSSWEPSAKVPTRSLGPADRSGS